jgi:hypothetical protein
MGRSRRVMALPLDVKWADIEFEWELPRPQPAKKKVAPAKVVPARKQLSAKDRNRRRKVQRYRQRRREKQVAKHLKELAKLIASDLLDMRVESFVENEVKWREQQQGEAKAYAEKLAAAFRQAVRKEAAEKTAA